VLVEIVHTNGKRYRIPAVQVVVYTDDGDPVALTYEHAGILIHGDVEHPDFSSMCTQLHVKRIAGDKRG